MTVRINRREILRLLAVAPCAAFIAKSRAANSDSLLVTTAAGSLHGYAAGGVRAFTGIPFGQAARFAPSVPITQWQGVFDATAPAKLAPQPADNPPFPAAAAEDCLQLNVWAPGTPGRHPVLVYIHGGANETGWSGDAAIAGDRFAAHGVVCVTVNYRVGALGFLEAGKLLGPDWRGSANNGIRDLVLALRWVRANIAAFGGDPDRVTLSGESAGGKNVGTLFATPAADGLYQAVAMFSGGAQTVHTMGEAEDFAALFAAKLGGAERLRAASLDDIIAAQQEAKAQWPHNFPFRPAVDGRFLPDIPLRQIQFAKVPKVPLLIGSNADESRLFLSAKQATGSLQPRSVANETWVRIADMDQRYANAFADSTTAERHWRLLTAEEYGMPCLRIAEAHAARHAPVHRYRFAYPAPGGAFQGYTPHALDVPFTFDHVDNPGFAGFFGLTPADQPMADIMHSALIAFVRDGSPSAAGLPAWPRFDLKERLTMVLGKDARVIADPDRSERLLWQS